MEKTTPILDKNQFTNKEKTNKLSINMIKLLIPNLEKSFYLNIIINESTHLKTKLLDFKKGNLLEINQVFDLDQSIQSIESLKFNLSEKNSIFSNIIYRGEYTSNKKYIDKTTNCNLCFLSNNDKENCIVVYFRYELNVDLIENFDDNLKSLNESIDIKTKNGQNGTLENLKDIASGENASNFSKFVKNMDYLKVINNEIINFIYWKDKWKTISIITFITLFIFFTQFAICISPIFIIFFHVYNRKNLNDFSFKNKKYDNLENINFITKLIDLLNFIIDLYENFVEAVQHCDKKIIEDIYINLIKLIFFNFFFFYSSFFGPSLIISFFLIIFWSYLLWNYPPVQAFCKFLFNFILRNFFNMNQDSLKVFITNYFKQVNLEYLGINAKHEKNFASNLPLGVTVVQNQEENESSVEKFFKNFIYYSNFISKKAFSMIPFARLILFIVTYDSATHNSNTTCVKVSKEKKSKFDFNEIFKNINQISPDGTEKGVDLNKDITPDATIPSQTLKYEIYENERWWMFIGWTKNLISNERPVWSDISGKNYLDFKSVFLPAVNYEWIGNWTIELAENTDDKGWEYSSDFNSKFSLSSFSKYVRRRKWVRYAKISENN